MRVEVEVDADDVLAITLPDGVFLGADKGFSVTREDDGGFFVVTDEGIGHKIPAA